MGVGINLGNTFDANYLPHDAHITKAQVDLYAHAGFTHIRIPVTWRDHFPEPLIDDAGRLDTESPRFKSLQATVDHALSLGLYVILNTHHEMWLKHHYTGPGDDLGRRFADMWKAIATHFADRGDRLMFEVLNEPEGTMGDWSGGLDPHDPVALERTRSINLLGYQAIRSIPGNRYRIILIAPNGMGNYSMIQEVYPRPEDLPGGGRDPYLMVTLHTYDPWDFCGQDGSNSVYLDRDQPLQALRRDIDERIDATARWAEHMPVAVHFGEYGIGRKDAGQRDHTIVREYYRYLTHAILQKGWAASVWDDRGWFAITNQDYDAPHERRWVYGLAQAVLESGSKR